MSSTMSLEIKQEFLKSKMGITGISILAILILVSIVAMITIPIDTFQEWNNPTNWIAYPKVAVPVWVNFFTADKIPEHIILENPSTQTNTNGEISLISHQFGFNFGYDKFPNDFIYEFSSEYSGTPLLQMSIIRPDGIELDLISTSLPLPNKSAHTMKESFLEMNQ